MIGEDVSPSSNHELLQFFRVGGACESSLRQQLTAENLESSEILYRLLPFQNRETERTVGEGKGGRGG